jgi:hypothetical protein
MENKNEQPDWYTLYESERFTADGKPIQGTKTGCRGVEARKKIESLEEFLRSQESGNANPRIISKGRLPSLDRKEI